MKYRVCMVTVTLAYCFLGAFPVHAAGNPGAVVGESGVSGGLVVCIEPDDPDDAAALRVDPRYVVQALYADPGAAMKARKQLAAAGVLGPVGARVWNGTRLPFANDLVRLIVAGSGSKLSPDEIMRALCPGGVAMVRSGGGFTKMVKPWPDDIDEWTHYLHGPDNNAVAADTRIGPPRSIRWVAGPRWARSHDHLSSFSAAVSAAGRLFCILDEGPADSVAAPSTWKLVARDAFSGVLLWKKDVNPWEDRFRPFRSGPVELQRRLVAAGDRVYATLGYGTPVSVLDAATGDVLQVFEDTGNTHEILLAGGRLYLVISDPPRKDCGTTGTLVKRLKPWTGRDVYRQYVVDYPPRRLMALDAKTGKTVWKKEDDDTTHLMPGALAVAGDRVYLENEGHVVALDNDTGKVCWRAKRSISLRRPTFSSPTLVVADGVVLSGDRSPKAAVKLCGEKTDRPRWLVSPTMITARGEIVAFDANTGKKLWTAPCQEAFNSPVDIFVARGRVWSGWTKSHRQGGITQVFDLKTGAVVAERAPAGKHITVGFVHGRCHRNKATVNYVIHGRAGVEFVDMRTDRVIADHWVRGACQYGFLPCNGLLYAPPHSCACYNEAKLSGFYALSAETGGKDESGGDRLLKGPAFSEIGEGETSSAGWPTYRGDGARSGRAGCAVPAAIAPAWEFGAGGTLTQPVAAGGRVYVARADTNTIHALDAGSGKQAWAFPAAGGIDSPPTVHGGAVYVGSRDGCIYCLRAADGALAWRFRAAPADRQVISYNRPASAWPLSGSVLLHKGSLYAVAGRSSYLDGGMVLYRLDPRTGAVRSSRRISHRREDGREPQDTITGKRGTYMPGALPDVLSAKGASIFLRHLRFDAETNPLKPAVDHLFSPAGFLDDHWWHRTYWLVGTAMLPDYHGWPVMGCSRITGRLLVCGGETVYGFGRTGYTKAGSHLGVNTGYHLFAAAAALGKPVPPKKTPGNWWRAFPGSRVQYRWKEQLPFLARAMVLAGETLFVAGPERVTDFRSPKPAGRVMLRAVSAVDGKKRAAYELASPPVFDGLSAAGGRLLLATEDGRVVCFGPK